MREDIEFERALKEMLRSVLVGDAIGIWYSLGVGLGREAEINNLINQGRDFIYFQRQRNNYDKNKGINIRR